MGAGAQLSRHGGVCGVPLTDGNFYYCNMVVICTFGLKSRQLARQTLGYAGNPEQSRETNFSKSEKHLRYELLEVRLDTALEL